MLTNEDTQKLIDAMKEVFPTAEMVKREFDAIGQRLDDIEKILLAKQEARIEKLEAQMKEVRESLAI